MAFTPYSIKSVQHLAAVGISNNPTDYTINAVNVSNTSLSVTQCTTASSSNTPYGSVRCYLLNSTTIRVEWAGAAGCYLSVDIVEYYPGFLRQPVQYFLMEMANIASISAATTALGPKAFVLDCGYIHTGVGPFAFYGYFYNLFLSGNSVVAGRYASPSPASETTFGIRCCVVDPK